MQQIISCPGCQRKLQVPDTLLGQDVQCPTCGIAFVAQLAGQPPPPPAPSPAAAPPAYDRPPPSPRRDDYGLSTDPWRRDLQPHRGNAVMTLGILSLVGIVLTVGLLSVILGPIAWVMGQTDLEEIRHGRMDPEGENSTNAGKICGMIGTLAGAVVLFSCCVLFFIGMIAERRHGF